MTKSHTCKFSIAHSIDSYANIAKSCVFVKNPSVSDFRDEFAFQAMDQSWLSILLGPKVKPYDPIVYSYSLGNRRARTLPHNSCLFSLDIVVSFQTYFTSTVKVIVFVML